MQPDPCHGHLKPTEKPGLGMSTSGFSYAIAWEPCKILEKSERERERERDIEIEIRPTPVFIVRKCSRVVGSVAYHHNRVSMMSQITDHERIKGLECPYHNPSRNSSFCGVWKQHPEEISCSTAVRIHRMYSTVLLIYLSRNGHCLVMLYFKYLQII